jgi:hypothetical protein
MWTSQRRNYRKTCTAVKAEEAAALALGGGMFAPGALVHSTPRLGRPSAAPHQWLDDRLTVSFTGFEEPEDFATRTDAFAKLIPLGIVSPTEAARLLHPTPASGGGKGVTGT